MESRTLSRDQRHGRREWSRVLLLSIKVAAGLGLLGALFLWGRIDLRALSGLAQSPGTVAACTLLIFLLLPLGALRWGFLLGALQISIPLAKLFHFVGIGMIMNMFLLGSVGGDAARGLYAWRAVGHGSARIAISLVADRLLGLLALLSIALAFAAFNWHWMRHIPALAALGVALFAIVGGAIAAAAATYYVSRLALPLEERLSHWRRLAGLIGRVRNLVLLIRTRPWHLLAAFALSLVIHVCVVAGVVAIAAAAGLRGLTTADYMFAVPLTLVANAVPLTPNGIGIGEAAFDQICRWLEPVPTGAAYSSIFLAFRATCMLACLPGFASLALYRTIPKPPT